MAYSAFAVANSFLQRAKERGFYGISPMKLQKLVYFAQAWHLRGLRYPLLDDNFCRWQHGPVVPSLYHEFKDYGYHPIDRLATTLSRSWNDGADNVPIIPAHDRNSWNLIDAVLDQYGHLDAATLSNMTHQPGSAWAKYGADGSVMTYAEILEDQTI